MNLNHPLMGETILHAKIDVAAATDNEIVAAVSGKKIIVIDYCLVAGGGANTCTWKSGSTALTGGMSFAANGGIAVPASPYGVLETVAGEALNLTLSAATSVDGHLSYVLR